MCRASLTLDATELHSTGQLLVVRAVANHGTHIYLEASVIIASLSSRLLHSALVEEKVSMHELPDSLSLSQEILRVYTVGVIESL